MSLGACRGAVAGERAPWARRHRRAANAGDWRKRRDLERRDINVRDYKNQTLPDLRLVGSYGRQALGTGAEDVFKDRHFRDKAVDYYYGVEVSFPWGNREAKLRLAQEKDMRQQAELTMQKTQQDIMAQVDDAIKSDRMKPSDAMRLLDDYERGLKEYTYLNF